MTVYEQRIEALRRLMKDTNIDTMLISTHENRFYLSGFDAEDSSFHESSGVLIISDSRLVLATDSRFELQAKNQAPLFETFCYKKSLASEFASITQMCSAEKIGFESNRLSFDDHKKIVEALSSSTGSEELIPQNGLVETLRRVKSDEEIRQMKTALDTAENAFKAIIALPLTDMTELEVSWELEKAMRSRGAESLSFPSIIASGPNSALPHAVPSHNPIKKNAALLIDWGAKQNNYCSDTTRTLVPGKPDNRFADIYAILMKAAHAATSHIRAGASSKMVDNKARSIIADHGFKDYFGHGLGHGVGLEVHEAPRLSPASDTVLETGMVITVEPGIYIPGWGGIRLENMVAVREDGAEILNSLDLENYKL